MPPCRPQRVPPQALAIIGGGPAGLMAAEVARAAGVEVDLYRGQGLGRTQVPDRRQGRPQPHPRRTAAGFDGRYGARQRDVGRWLDDFDGDALREWARGFGIETYIGTSGRVFPMDRKAAPLLRGWVRRLRDQGVRFHVQHRWLGWGDDGALRFATPDGDRTSARTPLVLALGGGSWPELGSDGAWTSWLTQRGVDVAPLQPSNCGFDIGWSEHFAQRHAGAPLKPVIAHWHDARRRGAHAAGRMRDHRHRHRRQPDLCAVGHVARRDRARRRSDAAPRPRAGPRPGPPATRPGQTACRPQPQRTPAPSGGHHRRQGRAAVRSAGQAAARRRRGAGRGRSSGCR